MSKKHKQYSDRAVARAVKAQKKDLRKIIDNQRWIEYRTDAVENADYPAPLADSYNKRDQKRIDKLVARCARRAEKYGIATYKPPADEADTQQAPADGDVIAAATEMLKGVLDAVKADTPQKDDASALCDEARALYARGAITEAAMQLAFDVADSGDADCIRRSLMNLQGATRRADKVDAA